LILRTSKSEKRSESLLVTITAVELILTSILGEEAREFEGFYTLDISEGEDYVPWLNNR
jgi:hypothetical protein